MVSARPVNDRPKQPVLFIMGPTAAGKTDLAVELVRRAPFAIISVDSAMVYRGLDIGTAKPDAATLATAPHRLIDICDPADIYSAARFCQDAVTEMQAITAAGQIPLLVGGTMLYFKALQQGLSELPEADPALRIRLAERLETEGLSALYQQLQHVDSEAAIRIHPHDPQRILRALEVYLLTGRPISDYYRQRKPLLGLFEPIKIVVSPREREVLHRRIELRFGEMLEQGLIDEVQQLKARPDLSLELPALRAVGYRQVWNYLEGMMNYHEMVQRGIITTRQFAKRQLTWLRAERQTDWYDSTIPELASRVIDQLYRQGFFGHREKP